MGVIDYPLVSIIIPVYNGSNYLREAINSALAQTYPNIEILVINDGSTDGGATHEIAMSFSDQIRYFQKENGGVVSALNYGIDHMRGEYFAWLSHDDLYLPTKIEKQVAALQNDKTPGLAFCVCNCKFINPDGQELYRSYVRQDHEFDQPACFLFLGCVGFNGIMVLIPKVLFDKCGKFIPTIATHEYDMWLRLMTEAHVVVEPEPLSVMRVHSQQVSKQNHQNVAQEIDQFMGNGIGTIPQADFHTFVTKRYQAEGAKYFFDLFNSYALYQAFPISTHQILKQLRLLFGSLPPSENALVFQLLGLTNPESAREYYAARTQDAKPLIALYCETINDEVMEEISLTLAWLMPQYEIALLYHQMDNEKTAALKDLGVMTIAYTAVDENMPSRISMLCHFLNARLFWYYNFGKGTAYTKVFHILKVIGIDTIASLGSIKADTAEQNSIVLSKYADDFSLLADALLITCSQASISMGLCAFEKLVVIPGGRLQALARWRMIFHALLENTGNCTTEDEVKSRLASVLEKPQIPTVGFVNDYVRGFVAEVNQKAAALVAAYEQRTFWRLTKPLRFGAWLFRNACKAFKKAFRQEESVKSIARHIRATFQNRSDAR